MLLSFLEYYMLRDDVSHVSPRFDIIVLDNIYYKLSPNDFNCSRMEFDSIPTAQSHHGIFPI